MTKIDDIVFNYNLQMNEFRNELALDKALNQDELTYDEISEREYDHVNFGFCYGDDILARNHFYMQIRNLEKINIDKEAYLNIACDDLDNYVFACRFCEEDLDIEIYKRQIKCMIAKTMHLMKNYLFLHWKKIVNRYSNSAIEERLKLLTEMNGLGIRLSY